MATKSILKNVKIKDTNLCRSFAEAIEKAQEMNLPNEDFGRKSIEIDKESVKNFFDNV